MRPRSDDRTSVDLSSCREIMPRVANLSKRFLGMALGMVKSMAAGVGKGHEIFGVTLKESLARISASIHINELAIVSKLLQISR